MKVSFLLNYDADDAYTILSFLDQLRALLITHYEQNHHDPSTSPGTTATLGQLEFDFDNFDRDTELF